MTLGKPPVEMAPREFEELRTVLLRYAGLQFSDEQRYLLTRRLGPRLEAAGARSFGEYIQILRSGPGARRELEEAVDRVTINETYFFREDYQLRAFSDEILPDLRRRHCEDRKLSIWSAGCATGEEPYTISMLLLEDAICDAWDLRVIGSDISRRALRAASRGRYRTSALRHTTHARQQRFFDRVGDGYEIREQVRAPVALARLNLLDVEPSDIIRDVDVIFCRNVLIYLSAESRQRVIRSFFNCLVPGGYLLLGHSENLLNLPTDFELVQLQNDTVYRRPIGSGATR